MTRINELKETHIHLIRKCFYDGSVWIKNDLSSESNISKSLTTNILQELLERKEIVYLGQSSSTGGRKSKEYQINKDYYHLLNISLKREKNKYLMFSRIIDLLNNCLYEREVISNSGSLDELIDYIKMNLLLDLNIQIVTISIPGVCNNGYIDVCDYRLLENINLINEIESVIGKTVVIENDVNVACIGFSYDYKDYQHLSFVYQPEVEYTGCGVMINGKLFNGMSHFVGELRYLPFYQNGIQEKLIKNQPLKLLVQQIETLCCIINPQIIGICSDIIEEDIDIKLVDIPVNHQPLLVRYNKLDKLIDKGLYHIGKNRLLEREGK